MSQLGYMVQMPQGQVSAQKPQAIHFLSSDTYSKVRSGPTPSELGKSTWRRLIAPVGQMAFTNYLTQTLIMTSLFYMPWGPRLMGQIDYPGQWAIVVAVWALQLIWSPLWLSRFRMGPLEWLWRAGTIRSWQVPFRRISPQEQSVPAVVPAGR